MNTDGGGWTLAYYSDNTNTPSGTTAVTTSPVPYSSDYYRMGLVSVNAIIGVQASTQVAIEGYDIDDGNKKHWEVGTFLKASFSLSTYFSLKAACNSSIQSPMYSLVSGVKGTKGAEAGRYCHESSESATNEYGGL